ncbi:MAG: hypothetical protein ACREP7_08020, partial [Lysobacter sp.]
IMNTLDEKHEPASDHEPTAPQHADVPSYEQEAKRLFTKEILPRWSAARNVWRTAWAMDTVIDYFTAFGLDSSGYGDTAMEALNPMNRGSWWDDFGWIGIAALRAAEQGFVPQRRDDFVKVALNAWAYMQGPGWSRQPTSSVYPFPDLPGWDQFAIEHPDNIGAPNVWKQVNRTRPNPQPPAPPNAWIGPRCIGGGVWNSPLTLQDYPDPVQ